jgi:putative phosphoesterase
MALFDSLGVEHVVHCGDIGGTEVLDELVGRPCTFVWGNMDQASSGLLAYLKTVGLEVPRQIPTVVTLDGKIFAIFHGHEPEFGRATRTLRADYILHGHTHAPRDEHLGETRIINPGALHRARGKTVATLETATNALTFHHLEPR